MSAAEQADPSMPALTDRGEAAIIDFSTRARAGRRSDSRRRKPVSNPQPGSEPGGGPSIHKQLAERFEATFNNHRLTLTDEITADTFAVTLKIVQEVLLGAEAQGIVDPGQRGELDAMIEGMASARHLIV